MRRVLTALVALALTMLLGAARCNSEGDSNDPSRYNDTSSTVSTPTAGR